MCVVKCKDNDEDKNINEGLRRIIIHRILALRTSLNSDISSESVREEELVL
jgi:hypothetical protein